MGAAPKTEESVDTSAADQEKAKKAEAQIFDIKIDTSDLGRVDTLRYNILSWVLNDKYDVAIKELKDTLERPSEYPDFHKRTHRFINHAVDLIYAIKAKRNFSGINSLTRAKQQELREKFKEHFNELQYILRKVEKIERDIKIADMRSTIYIVRAFWIAGLSIVLAAFLLEVMRGLAHAGIAVFDDTLSKLVNWLFELMGM